MTKMRTSLAVFTATAAMCVPAGAGLVTTVEHAPDVARSSWSKQQDQARSSWSRPVVVARSSWSRTA